MHRFLALSFVFSAACSFNDAADDRPDPADPLTCTDASSRRFAVDRVALPFDVDGEIDGLDLDGDGTIDNAGGFLLAHVLETYAEHGVATAWSAQLEARLRQVPWIIEACEDGSVVAMDRAPLGALADLRGGADDGWQPVVALAGDLDVAGDEASGVIGLGFGPSYREVIGRSFARWLDALLAAGNTAWGVTIDTDGDGAVSFEELDANVLFDLMMTPDLDALGDDGVAESISFGIEIHATSE